MPYVDQNFKTKKAFKEAVKDGQAIYLQPTTFKKLPMNAQGGAFIEGPWYPQPHTWYAEVKCDNHGKVISVK